MVASTFKFHCVDQLVTRQVLRTEIWRDQSDNRQYTVYCKTDLLNALCPIITRSLPVTGY
jgi:hypothetical protein